MKNIIVSIILVLSLIGIILIDKSSKLLLLLILILSLSLSFLVNVIMNKNFTKNKDKIIIFILEAFLVAIALALTIPTQNNIKDQTSKDKVILDKSNIIAYKNVNLGEEKSDITITEGGSYTLSGTFSNSVIIDTEDEVELILDNVEINNSKTATIIGLNAKKITITLADQSINKLSDGGNSEYDGCIFSNAPLEFNGSGTLIVNGNQNEGEGIATETQTITFNDGIYQITSNDDGINAGGDGATITINGGKFYINANGDGIDSNQDLVINGGEIFVIGSDKDGDSGIDTDDGYTINGGVVIALGTDMIELPESTSKANTLAFSLNSIIPKDTLITLKSEIDQISFNAPKSFKTIIISMNFNDTNYSLYQNPNYNDLYGIIENVLDIGEILEINQQNDLKIDKQINYYK